ncbi:MAG TPA: hypothetical protein VEL74_19870 [Thermoanaerobaculia bacterium]|nr:hypothetical protein [Thermoanaerobaculia bacterium]
MASDAIVKEVSTFTPTAVEQQVFTLSCLSGMASKSQMSQSDMQEQLRVWEANIGTWKAVWGPCYTFKPLATIPCNTMYVAQALDAAQPTYVVAIAGTVAGSFYDWMTEDLNIAPVDWPHASNAGQVTTGDNDGLNNLLKMTYEGQTLQEFLSSITNKSSASLTFTGHSLGGALAPMLTLALMDPASTLKAENDVSIGNWAEVSLLATAGPAIGDVTFVQYFNAALAAASCTFIWNVNDVVPHAWNQATMMELTSPTNIYNLTLDPSQCLANKLGYYQGEAGLYTYTQFEQVPAFAGVLQPYTMSISQGTWTPESEFLAQALYQHINAYGIAFNCTGWVKLIADPCADPKLAAELLAAVNALCE